MTWDEAVAFALKLEGTELATSYRQPAVKANGRTILNTGHEPDTSFVLHLEIGLTEMLIETHPDTFWKTPHYAGYGAVLVRYDSPDEAIVRDMIERAWRRGAGEDAEETTLTRRFAQFVCIDWSGAAVERPPGIAMASCDTGTAAPVLLRPERGWSRQAMLDWLVAHGRAGTDMLIGIDFSPSLPFADRGAFFPGWPDNPDDARGLWALVDALAADDPHLGAGGFVDHPQASRHFRRHGGRAGDLFGSGIGRLRETERACRAARLGLAQSCFNLVGAAQVGKSSLTGMRLLHRLTRRVPIWPFDPAPARGPLIVEIYTTIAARAAGVRGGSKLRDGAALDRALAVLGSAPHAPLARYDDHSTDAILAAAWLRHVAGEAPLWHPTALTAALAATEGWTFGVP